VLAAEFNTCLYKHFALSTQEVLETNDPELGIGEERKKKWSSTASEQESVRDKSVTAILPAQHAEWT
jgi:hypothetical protein